jgi:hypothetical protein
LNSKTAAAFSEVLHESAPGGVMFAGIAEKRKREAEQVPPSGENFTRSVFAELPCGQWFPDLPLGQHFFSGIFRWTIMHARILF